jgi:hypothetical protein
MGDRQCPHCGAALRTTTATRASAVLMGLALAGCPGDDSGTSTTFEPEYGVPDTASATDTEGTTAGTTDGSTIGESSATAGEADYGTGETVPPASTSAGEADYGVPDTGSPGSTSAGEPDYGVPETTSG